MQLVGKELRETFKIGNISYHRTTCVGDYYSNNSINWSYSGVGESLSPEELEEMYQSYKREVKLKRILNEI